MNFKKSLIIGASVLTLVPVASATFMNETVSAIEHTESSLSQNSEYI
ncbi:hypothetical protein NUITMVRA1_18650 [Aerococcus viridans]|nr:hypothetical protein NUITMVRA1_18650 [Aerococcus viridans]